MKIHRTGRTIVALSAGAFLLCILLLLLTGHFLFQMLSVLFFIWNAFVLNFFRNPDRPVSIDPNAIISPADGKIVIIKKVFEPEFLQEERWQISIFMSPLNVHANRYPISGTIEHYKYHPGKYLVAWHPKSSTANERNTIVIRHENGKNLLLRQIAGAVARRIVCYVKKGESVTQGDELGFIKFGSRVDLFLPLDVEILVKDQQIVRGNVDTIALWNKN